MRLARLSHTLPIDARCYTVTVSRVRYLMPFVLVYVCVVCHVTPSGSSW